MKSNLLRLIPILLWANPLQAQEPSSVSAKVDLVAWGKDIPGLSIKPGNKTAAVTAKAFQYSKELSYSGPAIMEIDQDPAALVTHPVQASSSKDPTVMPPPPPLSGQAKAAAASDEPVSPELAKRRKDHPNLVALAELPANSKRVTILLSPGPANTYRAVVIDDDPAKLPPGKLRVHNFSPMPIAFHCQGEEPHELKPRESFVVTPKNHQVIYEFAYRDGDQWKQQENNILRVADGEQAQFIILKSEDAYFQSGNGTRNGFLQAVTLRREPPANP